MIFGSVAHAQIQVSARYVGTVTAGDSDLTISGGETLSIVLQEDTSTVYATTTLNADGSYDVSLAQDIDFNGTVLTYILRSGNTIYQIVTSNGGQFVFQYLGLPSGLTSPFDVVVGSVLQTLSSGDDSEDEIDLGVFNGIAPTGLDYDQDGVLDEQDINLVKQAVVVGSTDSVYDLNLDGRVNIADVIQMIRTYREVQRFSRQQEAEIPDRTQAVRQELQERRSRASQ